MSPNERAGDNGFRAGRPWLWLSIALLLGALPRLYNLGAQILIDDEWHGLAFVVNKSYWQLLRDFHPSDHSSPPYNLYRLWLHNVFGWTELGLRLPALLASLATVVLLPLRVLDLVGRRVAVLFGFLLAVSPFLVSYGRFSRSYSLIALLGFVALFSLFAWIRGGRRREALLAAVCGTLAVWTHPTAVVVVGVPIAAAWGWMLVEPRLASRKDRPRRRPGARELLIFGGCMALPTVALVLPMFSRAAELPLGRSSPTFGAVLESLRLLAGTGSWTLTVILILVIGYGLMELCRRHPLHGGVLLVTGLAQLLALVVARPTGSDNAVVVLRYGIWLVPLGLLLTAIGFDRLTAKLEAPLPRLRPAAAAALVLLLVWQGPLLRTYAAPNNFTGHSAFQGSYDPVSWERSDARHIYTGHEIDAGDVPPFYRRVAGEAEVVTLVEYPFDIANANNLFYFYQHFHGKSVLAGYSRSEVMKGYVMDRTTQERTPGHISNPLVDRFLRRNKDASRLRFRNMVEVTDPEALRASGADLLVLHKTQVVLHLRGKSYGTIKILYLGVTRMLAALEERGLRPIFEDDEMAVFRIADL